jgi:hypothetical protein
MLAYTAAVLKNMVSPFKINNDMPQSRMTGHGEIDKNLNIEFN